MSGVSRPDNGAAKAEEEMARASPKAVRREKSILDILKRLWGKKECGVVCEREVSVYPS